MITDEEAIAKVDRANAKGRAALARIDALLGVVAVRAGLEDEALAGSIAFAIREARRLHQERRGSVRVIDGGGDGGPDAPAKP